MGKQKRPRHKPHKENPTGLPSVKDFEESEEVTEENRGKALHNVYDEVQSSNLEEKLSALQTLESMSCDSSMAVQIAKDGIARIVGPLLIDRVAVLRAATASTLRQIADNGGEEAYSSLIKDDIMTPLVALLRQYYSEWQPKSKEKEALDEKETFIQAITLLWTLCENNESVIKCINNEDLAPILIKFLNIDTYGIDIVIVTVQCMISLSEDNDTAIKKIKQSEEILYGLLTNLTADSNKTVAEVLSLKTSIVALLVNISSLKSNDQLFTHCQASFMNTLSEVLAVDHREILSSLISILPHERNASSNNKKKKVQESRRMLGTQQQALEILANLCFEEEDGVIDSDMEDSETIEMESECMDDDSMNDNLKMTSTFPVELVEVINHHNLIDKIWNKTVAMDKDNSDILDQTAEGKAVLKQFHTLRCRAYLCLNNLLSSLEIDVLGSVDDLYRKWLEIGEIVFKDCNPDDIELLEAATAAMRAILQRLTEIRDMNVFKQLTVTDIQPMLNGERQCSNANIRANLIRMLGNLISILMNNGNPDSHDIIKHISIFLLNVCVTETQAWVIAESIDAIMDAYTEDETDHLAADIQLVSRLQSSVSHFKNKVRQQKKHLGNNMSIISTVNANLTRFIKYKERQIRNLK